MKIKMLLSASAIVAACVVQAGAGEVVSRFGSISAVPLAADAVHVRVQSVHGWTCEGVYAEPARAGAAVKFPLTCSDEVEGKAVMSVEDGRAALLFRRDDGSKGSAAVTLN